MSILCESFGRRKDRCPELLRALKYNYWIEQIHLTSALSQWLGDPWNVDDKMMVEKILSLNKCNRRYLQDEASNKQAGTQVLADVGNDMDCIYYHVLENPLLVYRND